ncbi:class I SAM-dependent DNA methyltransferase [Micromonospora deserti]|uniref:SAM-dependent methyltransferase n=1 Tax=Micromonospora deserti TaxID=2070366 RepID=A0A2W2EAG4_9ACTN|nr:class I SAM-dependent methyltransferase [Micromonospora deserti]PZG01824.1 SAM-dependent methyltransferase [Micromonospora deserti]
MTEVDFLDDTRTSYDAFAAEYAEQFRDELDGNTWDRAFLAAFAEVVRAAGGGPVADIGCGPGRVTHHLHGLGLDVFGIDLSPGMLAQARRSHPQLRFSEGSMTDLHLPDGGLSGIVAWYSVIHVPDELLPATFAGFHRALAPGGHLALAFQVGDEPLHLTEALGHPVDLTFHRRQPDRVAALLTAAGLEVRARLVREPEAYAGRVERTAQAYLLARRPAAG